MNKNLIIVRNFNFCFNSPTTTMMSNNDDTAKPRPITYDQAKKLLIECWERTEEMTKKESEEKKKVDSDQDSFKKPSDLTPSIQYFYVFTFSIVLSDGKVIQITATGTATSRNKGDPESRYYALRDAALEIVIKKYPQCKGQDTIVLFYKIKENK